MRKISRRNFTKTITAGLGTAVINPFSGLSAKEIQTLSLKKRPNIVFICADQHSYKYTGYAGHHEVKTSNLDRIAGQGVIFSDAYSGNPIRVPDRTSMMTGMLASDCNSFCNSTVWDGSHPVWGTYLKKEGYYCRAIGKMDLNNDFDSGFDEIETSHGHRTNSDITSLFRRPVAYRIDERPNVDGGMRKERHGDAAKTRLRLKFLREDSSNLKKSWALYLELTEPHPKFEALEEYYNLYPEYSVDMPNIPPGHLEELHLVFQELRHYERIATPIPEDRIRRARAAYYGMVIELDEYIGKIWDELERSDELKNTLFNYTSDHGESLGEHGLWNKNNLYDVAARVPLVMAGAGLPRNIKIDTPVAHVDVVATMLELAASDAFNKLRGHSLLPILQGKSGSHPGFDYSESHSGGDCTGSFMIRKGDWKYIHFTWYDDLLFNVTQDSGEFNNLIDKPETADIQAELKKILYSLVDPEDVTLRAFHAQEKMLAGFSALTTEEQLFNLFKGRLGPEQARALAKKYKGLCIVSRQNIVKIFGKSFPAVWYNATKFCVHPVKSALQNRLFNRVNQILMTITLSSISGISRICKIAAFSADGLVKALLKLDKAINENAISSTLKNLGQSGARKLQMLLLSKNARWLHESGLESITLDADSTVKSVCGNQEGAEKGFNTTKKGAKNYHPLLVFISEMKLLYHTWFRTGSAYTANGIVDFLKEVKASSQKHSKSVFSG